MTGEFKRVIWEWLPGVVAGFMPLFVFLLVEGLAVVPPEAASTEAARFSENQESGIFLNGLIEHLLVFGIVTSSVSTFTSLPRLFIQKTDATPGPAVALVMSITLILVLSVALYVLHEARLTSLNAIWPSGVIVVVTLLTSLYMEVAIANVRLAQGDRSLA